MYTSVEKALSESEEKDERHEYGFKSPRTRASHAHLSSKLAKDLSVNGPRRAA